MKKMRPVSYTRGFLFCRYLLYELNTKQNIYRFPTSIIVAELFVFWCVCFSIHCNLEQRVGTQSCDTSEIHVNTETRSAIGWTRGLFVLFIGDGSRTICEELHAGSL